MRQGEAALDGAPWVGLRSGPGGGTVINYSRPNLGSFVDWNGDGKKDFIGCQFENSVRFYRNLVSNQSPRFASPEGTIILNSWTPQMISGADAVDWNGDGDLDVLTGQGHGGSGLRFFERDYLEDLMHNTRPIAKVTGWDARP